MPGCSICLWTELDFASLAYDMALRCFLVHLYDAYTPTM